MNRGGDARDSIFVTASLAELAEATNYYAGLLRAGERTERTLRLAVPATGPVSITSTEVSLRIDAPRAGVDSAAYSDEWRRTIPVTLNALSLAGPTSITAGTTYQFLAAVRNNTTRTLPGGRLVLCVWDLDYCAIQLGSVSVPAVAPGATLQQELSINVPERGNGVIDRTVEWELRACYNELLGTLACATAPIRISPSSSADPAQRQSVLRRP